jgi:hypothetical protein
MPFIPDPLSPWDSNNVKIASLSKTANNAEHHENMIAHHHSVARSLKSLAEKYDIIGDKDSSEKIRTQIQQHLEIAGAHRQVMDYMNNVPRPDSQDYGVGSPGTYQSAACQRCNGTGIAEKNTLCDNCRGTGSKINFNKNPE